MSKTPRIPIPSEVRKYVFQRDKYQCQSCGKIKLETELTIDHIIPLSRSGAATVHLYSGTRIVTRYHSKKW